MSEQITLRARLLRAIEMRDESRQSNPDYVSAHEVGLCPLDGALRMRGVQAQRDDKGKLVLNAGTIAHVGLDRLLRLERPEEYFRDESLHLEGHIDGLLTQEDGTELVELKSIGTWALKKQQKKEAEGNGGLPYPHHRMQAHAYVHLLQEIGRVPIVRIHYAYWHKDSGDFVAEPTEIPDGEILAVVRARITAQHHLFGLAAGDLVHLADVQPWLDWNSCGEDKKSPLPWQCRYCARQSNCPIVGEVYQRAAELASHKKKS